MRSIHSKYTGIQQDTIQKLLFLICHVLAYVHLESSRLDLIVKYMVCLYYDEDFRFSLFKNLNEGLPKNGLSVFDPWDQGFLPSWWNDSPFSWWIFLDSILKAHSICDCVDVLMFLIVALKGILMRRAIFNPLLNSKSRSSLNRVCVCVYIYTHTHTDKSLVIFGNNNTKVLQIVY